MMNKATSQSESLNWLVFGAGAIGTYLGGSLLLHGHQVTFLEQPSTATEVKQRGLSLQLSPGSQQYIPEPCIVSCLEQAFQYDPFDAAIFALKSFDTASVLEKIAPYIQSIPPLICFQNGVENEARLASVFGEDRVIAGTVTSSVSRRAAGEIVLERSRGIGLSSLHPLANTLAHAFQDAGLITQLFPHPADMKWSKMLTNLVGNATSAILDLTPAQVFTHPQLYNLEIRQLRETLTVMRAHRIGVVNLPKMPVRWLGFALQHLPSRLVRNLLSRAVGGGRGEKMPSFHIDLHSGRKQSEVDYLNGAVVRYGQAVGVPTPVNRMLNHTLLQLIDGSLPCDRFSHQPQALLDLLSD